MLGAMLLSNDAAAAVIEICGPEDFYKPAHAQIFRAIVALFERGEAIDAVTVADELRRSGVLDSIGDPSLLISLQASTPSIANAVHYARIVEEHALLRRMVGVAGEIAEIGFSVPEDVDAALDRAESLVFDIAVRRTTDTVRPLHDVLLASLDRIEELSHGPDAITGLPTGYVDLDAILAGLQPSSLTIVGARPSMGKTSFALGLLAHIGIELRRPALLFSLEMGHLELCQRLLASEARVDSQRLRTGRLHESDWAKVGVAVSRLDTAPIFIDDNPNLTVMDIRARARRLRKTEGDLAVVVVDYLQLMTGRGKAENRQVEVSEISRGLKILARELEVPVVALSQLSRSLEARQDKRPMLSDLRESGCMPATTTLLRADTGAAVTMGELILTQERPLVWSIDDHGRLVPRRVTKVFPSGVRFVSRLRLASGLEVEATSNHPFRTLRGWEPLGRLHVGDAIAVPCRMHPPMSPQQWDEDELILLAHLLGRGTMGPGVRYTTGDLANCQAVENAARRRFDVKARISSNGRTWQVELPAPYRLTRGRHHPMRNWLESLGLWNRRSHERFIPESLFAASDEQIALFLRHLWSAGGSVVVARNPAGPMVQVSYSSQSLALLEGVRRTLLRLGITARSRPSGKAGRRQRWELQVTGLFSLRRFFELVGCQGQRSWILPSAFEVIPALSEVTGTPDVYWDEIIEITPIGEKPTFDATVEDTHNFVANGICAHNSLEQDADVVIFIYREEQYDPDLPIERQGDAEIIVAKHRNGPTGSVHLAFLSQYARFENMSRI